MLRIFKCRRSSLALIAIGLLTFMAIHNGTDTSMSIATIVLAVAAANSTQGIYSSSKKDKE